MCAVQNRQDPMHAIQNMLPRGFHDAVLYEVRLDVDGGGLDLILTPDMSSPGTAEWVPVYPRCRLRFGGLECLEIEPLVFVGPPSSTEQISVDISELRADRLAKIYPRPLVEGQWAYEVFMFELNAYIHVIAREVTFEWLDERSDGCD